MAPYLKKVGISMDIALFFGLILGFGMLILSIVLSGSLIAFWDVKSILITIGGSIAALIVNFPMQDLLRIGKVLKVAMSNKQENPRQIIDTIVKFAEISRREGLLVLEEKAQEVDDEFLQKGIQLVVDGTDPELVRSILEIEISYMEARHETGQQMFEQLGAYCPAFGMIGTLIGLVLMLQELDDPSALGPAMAVALITTLYGAVLANLVFLPIAGKLRIKNAQEVLIKEIMIEGILSIRAGENPRIIEEKLLAFLPRYEKISRGDEDIEPFAEEVRTSA